MRVMRRYIVLVAGLGGIVHSCACDRSSSSSSTADADQAPSSASSAALAPPALFEITFQVVDGVMDEKTPFRGTLRITTSDGQRVDYVTPVRHSSCYLLAGETHALSDPRMRRGWRAASPVPPIEGDAGHLICTGGGRSDEATFRRTSEGSVEVSVYQQDYGGADAAPPTPMNAQTFSLQVPKGLKIRAMFAQTSWRVGP